METARFQIVGGLRVAGRLVPPWPVVARGVPEPAEGDGENGTWFAWRLLSRNNRDLARSPAVHDGEAECRASIERIRRTAADAETVLVRAEGTGRWTWSLQTADAVVATGSRGYLRRRECHDCVAQVVELVAVALDPDPKVVLPARPGLRHVR